MTDSPGTDPPPPSLQLGVLGPLTVRRPEGPVVLGGRQQKAILAVLLVEADHVVSVARLADALWGAQVPPGAVTTIQAHISRLRERLEPGRVRGTPGRILRTEAGGYRLALDDATLDAAVFEQGVRVGRAHLAAGRFAAAAAELTTALALWRGPVLADLAGYEFVAPIATRLEELQVSAVEARVEADLALGRHQDVVDELDRLVTAHPLREQLHSQRMLALYRCGRQADALAAYRRLRDTLADELGIDPSLPVQQRHQAILAQDPGLDWREPEEAAGERVRPPATKLAAPEGQDRAERAKTQPRRRSPTRRLVPIGAIAVAAILAGGATAAVVHRSGTAHLAALPANSIGWVDSNGALRKAVPVGQSPTGLAYGAGSVWVADTGDRSITRVDLGSSSVRARVEVGADPTAIVLTDNDVWVANFGDGTVSRVNVRTELQTQAIKVGTQPVAIAAGAGGIWVANQGDDTIQRIDPATGRTDPPIQVGGQPAGIAVLGRTVWVSNTQDGTVSRVDAPTGRVDSPVPVGSGPRGIAVTEQAVWVANSLDQTVSRIDPAPGGRVTTVAVGDGPDSIVAGPDGVWVSNEFDATLTRLDPLTGAVRRRVATGGSPRGLALVGGSVWVASASFAGQQHRGGTLTVATQSVPEINVDPDPASSYELNAMALTYDGLVAQRHSGGSAGLTIVPDLAVRVPAPTAGGTVYTFTLRRGVFYSSGGEVQPEDIKRGIRRALLAGTTGYFLGIVGADTCTDVKTVCQLDRGVSTDAATRQISITLKTPDPDFLYKLTAFAVATPPGVPVGHVARPFAGTGPYLNSAFKAGDTSEVTLTRNPTFRQWSFAAKPDGYPDVIRWRLVPDAAARVRSVETGQADFTDLLVDPPLDVQLRFPDRLHIDPRPKVYEEWFNTRVKPFDNLDVRRAVNFAVDREELVRRIGATQVQVSCQVFPPNLPGYRSYCPYTLHPTPDGAYHGPDLAEAKRLVKASGTLGALITVRAPNIPVFLVSGQYYVEVLRSLGYRVPPLVVMPGDDYFAYVSDSSHRAQIGGGSWIADFPTPSNFWAPDLSCASFVPHSEANSNWSEFCDPAIDRLGATALSTQRSNSAAARALWADLDSKITDQAPWVLGPPALVTGFVSARVGNYQSHPVDGPMLDQMWVQ